MLSADDSGLSLCVQPLLAQETKTEPLLAQETKTEPLLAQETKTA